MQSQDIKPANQLSSSQNPPNSNTQQQQEEGADLYHPSGLERSQRVKKANFSSYWDDLIELLQLSVVLILIIFVFLMGYMIVSEVHQLWFQQKQDSFSSQKDINFIQNDPNIATDEENFIGEAKSQEHEMQQALIKKQGQQNIRQQDSKDQKIQTSTPKETQHKIPFSSPKDTQVYDPVLIQLNKYKKQYGSKYKETIYTMRNTSIAQAQYQRSKKLIELTKFYDSKEKKFKVRQNFEGQNCGNDDLGCEKKQAYIDSIVEQQISYYEKKYDQPFISIKTQLPFCIIVPSYKNNQDQNIFRNLNSIFQQKYDNFHVIYIDDASKDGTLEVVREYMKKYDISDQRLLFIENSQNQKALKNIFTAAHEHCKQKEIMIIVDGDDYLIGTQVLRFLNFQYQTKKLLAAYTNYLRINQPYYIKVGTSTPYPQHVLNRRFFRKMPNMFRASHLRSYYVDLFRKIKPEDLKDQHGQFFTAANDFAIMMPILEMASPHFEYLPELTYLYDSGTGLNNFQSKKEIQQHNVKTVAKRKIYNQIDWKSFYPEN